MTKTLTEQWKDGELEWGLYYVKTKKDAPLFYGEITEMSLEEEITISQDEKVEEVLSPVPSYDEWKAELASNGELLNVQKRLEKKLAIATKALKEIDVRSQSDWNEYDCMGCAKKALYDIEMEGVK